MNRFKIDVYEDEDIRDLLTKALKLNVVDNQIWLNVLADFCSGDSEVIAAYGLNINTLDFIENGIIREYSKQYLDLYSVDDALELADRDKLIYALEDIGYEFNDPLYELDDEDIVNEYFRRELEDTYDEDLDNVDSSALDEITQIFKNANWGQRQDILKTVKAI